MLTSKHENHPGQLWSGNSTAVSQHIKSSHVRQNNEDNFYSQMKVWKEVSLREQWLLSWSMTRKSGVYTGVFCSMYCETSWELQLDQEHCCPCHLMVISPAQPPQQRGKLSLALSLKAEVLPVKSSIPSQRFIFAVVCKYWHGLPQLDSWKLKGSQL